MLEDCRPVRHSNESCCENCLLWDHRTLAVVEASGVEKLVDTEAAAAAAVSEIRVEEQALEAYSGDRICSSAAAAESSSEDDPCPQSHQVLRPVTCETWTLRDVRLNGQDLYWDGYAPPEHLQPAANDRPMIPFGADDDGRRSAPPVDDLSRVRVACIWTAAAAGHAMPELALFHGQQRPVV